ncbi:MAG: recombination protein RecR [Desulfobulbaceae bacterium A2]|nr:MAG: recombination protein RecR [Desulfobulbaceae bacterium A2]
MRVMPLPLERLINELQRLPGVGRKSATRHALHLLRRPPAEARGLAEALAGLHESIQLCSRCFAFSQSDPCAVCADPGRNARQICVVEGPDEQLVIEKSGSYRGLYHLLHGVLAPIDGIGPEELRVDALLDRVRREEVEEVLLATSSTVPGEATASYLVDRLAGMPLRVTRLACGIPMGMDIRYADEHTLARAIENRQGVRSRD